MSDDITFCGNKDCKHKDCFRHWTNIKEPNIPHSFAYFNNTPECEWVKKNNKLEIGRAIEKYQKEHPIMGYIDVTKIQGGEESVKTVDSMIDKCMRQIREQTDMWCICEMAKRFMQGARPIYYTERKGEWIKDDFGRMICDQCQFPFAEFQSKEYCSCCGAKMKGDSIQDG